MIQSFHSINAYDSHNNKTSVVIHADDGMISFRGVSISLDDWLRVGLKHRLEIQLNSDGE